MNLLVIPALGVVGLAVTILVLPELWNWFCDFVNRDDME